MASIKNGRMIQEASDKAHRGGKTLVYGIGPHKPEIALAVHEFIYRSRYGFMSRRKLLATDMRHFLDELCPHPMNQWESLVESAETRLGVKKLKKETAELGPRPTKPGSRGGDRIGDVLRSFVDSAADKILLSRMPRSDGLPVDGQKGMIQDLLNKGSLTGHQGYSDYLAPLSQADKEIARRRVREIQELRGWMENWLAYFISADVKSVHHIEKEAVEAFPAWKTEKGLGSSVRTLKGDMAFIRAVVDYAQRKKLLQYDPIGKIKIETGHKTHGKKLESNDPLTPDQITGYLAKLKKLSVEGPEEHRQDFRLNYHTYLLLLLTGCRPKETRNYNVVKDTIRFHFRDLSGGVGGKTKSAPRQFKMGPVLKNLVSFKTLEINKTASDVAARLTHFFKRNDIDHNPYRLRHTTATIRFLLESDRAKIAYELGHTSPDFTYQKYTNLDAYADLDKEAVVEFWRHLNEDYVI